MPWQHFSSTWYMKVDVKLEQSFFTIITMLIIVVRYLSGTAETIDFTRQTCLMCMHARHDWFSAQLYIYVLSFRGLISQRNLQHTKTEPTQPTSVHSPFFVEQLSPSFWLADSLKWSQSRRSHWCLKTCWLPHCILHIVVATLQDRILAKWRKLCGSPF